MDEILGAAALRGSGKIVVTGELTVRYVAPAPLETPLLGRGRLIADHGRYIEVEGSLEELASAKIVSRPESAPVLPRICSHLVRTAIEAVGN